MSRKKTDTTSPEKPDSSLFFSNLAEDYARYRPSYPAAAINTILEGLSNITELVAADVGAGTGIASRLLAEQGVRVLAIEPNAGMRQAAEPHLLVEFYNGTAERTNLANASVDLVVSFQAFHWFDFIPSLVEFHRILKPQGRLALVWSYWDPSDKFTKNYIRLIDRAAKTSLRPRPGQPQGFFAFINHVYKRWQYWLFWQWLRLPRFVQVRRQNFTYQQALDLPGLIGLARSQGFVPQSGQEFEQLSAGLQELHECSCDASGLVYVAYCCRVYLATSPQK